MDQKNEKKQTEDNDDAIRCMECGQLVDEDRARKTIRACATCLPMNPRPVELGAGETARIVAEMTGLRHAGEREHSARASEERAAALARETLGNDAAGAKLRREVDRIEGRIPPEVRLQVAIAVADPPGITFERNAAISVYADKLAERYGLPAADLRAKLLERKHRGDTADELAASLRATKKHPPIVTLCGSTKFRREFEAAVYRLTLEGWAVLSVGSFGKSPEPGARDARDGLTPRQKEDLDALHLRKIAMSDRVHVLNPDGYIGASTTTEVGFAFALGISITFLDEPKGEKWLRGHSHELGKLLPSKDGPAASVEAAKKRGASK